MTGKIEQFEMEAILTNKIMDIDLSSNIDEVSKNDEQILGKLIYEAYLNTVDYEGESLEESIKEIQETFAGKYGPLISKSSFLIKENDKALSACIVVDYGEYKAPLIAFSMTHRLAKKQGYAKSLLIRSMQSLFQEGYKRVCLVVTSNNIPAISLYKQLGFQAFHHFNKSNLPEQKELALNLERECMVIETDRLFVRMAKNTKTDIEHYYKLWNHPIVMSNVGFPNGLQISKEELEDILTKNTGPVLNKRLVVILKETGELIGESKLGIPNDDAISDFDIKFFPEYWGQGLGSELLEEIVKYLFDNTDCQEIESTPNVENIGAQKMYEKLGFRIIRGDIYKWSHKHVHYYVRRIKRSYYKANFEG